MATVDGKVSRPLVQYASGHDETRYTKADKSP